MRQRHLRQDAMPARGAPLAAGSDSMRSGAQTLLRLLWEEVGEVQRVLLATSDGHLFAESSPPTAAETDPQTAAMAATALTMGQQLAAAVVGGSFVDYTVRTTSGIVMVAAVGSDHVLCVAAPQTVNQALLHRYAQRTVDDLGLVLGRATSGPP